MDLFTKLFSHSEPADNLGLHNLWWKQVPKFTAVCGKKYFTSSESQNEESNNISDKEFGYRIDRKFQAGQVMTATC